MNSKRKLLKIISFALSLLLVNSCLCLQFAVAENFWTVSYTTYNTTYEDIIKMYIKVMAADCRDQSRGRHDLYNEFMSYDSPEYVDWGIDKMSESARKKRIKELQEEKLQFMKNHYGFAIMDINGDGVDELILGCKPSNVYELFTMENGKVKELIRAGGRYSCEMLKDGSFLRFAGNGGGSYRYELFYMNDDNTVKFIDGYAFEGAVGHNVFAEDEHWFKINGSYFPTAKDMDKHVDSSVAKRWIDKHEANHANIHFIPFAAYEKGLDGNGIAILSVNGKTTGTAKVRVRNKPDNRSKIVAEKKVGTYVNAISMEGDYYKITIGKKTGYIHKDYLILLTDIPQE